VEQKRAFWARTNPYGGEKGKRRSNRGRLKKGTMVRQEKAAWDSRGVNIRDGLGDVSTPFTRGRRKGENPQRGPEKKKTA